MFKYIVFLFFLCCASAIFAQRATFKGEVRNSGDEPQAWIDVIHVETGEGTTTDKSGRFEFSALPQGTHHFIIRSREYENDTILVQLKENETVTRTIHLNQSVKQFDEVVVSGHLRARRKSDSPVPIEVYDAEYFEANPTPSIFESLQNVNGVRPQINCGVCNTGDIHINGLEGPYTMILLDGMPIVSGLGTVYGLNGIPQSMIESVEIVKGPASTLYGSEAVGGIINIITKNGAKAPKLSADVFTTSWLEHNVDLGYRLDVSDRVESLLGINYFNFDQIIDNNNDNFTDVALQDRVSIFNKWNFQRPGNKVFSLAGRYVYEDRWGGETNWSKDNRGSADVYGESVYTSRWELLGRYEIPWINDLIFAFSGVGHQQNSFYGDLSYQGTQNIGFGQLTWNSEGETHNWLIGSASRYTYYNDNSTATESYSSDSSLVDDPSRVLLPGVFVQDEMVWSKSHRLLLGLRYDYNSKHGSILTPRANYKWTSKDKLQTLRISAGSGYRVANIFTEDHAALTGSREVVFLNELNPERSWNANINYEYVATFGEAFFATFDATAFYTYFDNKIIPDYSTDPTKIIYDNLGGYAVSTGVSLNADIRYKSLTARLGGTLMDVSQIENDQRIRQEFQERYTVTWNIGYEWSRYGLKFDYTGSLYGPMKLPLQGELDPRPEFADPWSIQNIKISKHLGDHFKLYGGIKNLLNWTPGQNIPFLISRAHDPFDEEVAFNAQGDVMATENNPYALTFDPEYIYGPNQGIRFFMGLKYSF